MGSMGWALVRGAAASRGGRAAEGERLCGTEHLGSRSSRHCCQPHAFTLCCSPPRPPLRCPRSPRPSSQGSANVEFYRLIAGWSARQIWRRAGFAFFGVSQADCSPPSFTILSLLCSDPSQLPFSVSFTFSHSSSG